MRVLVTMAAEVLLCSDHTMTSDLNSAYVFRFNSGPRPSCDGIELSASTVESTLMSPGFPNGYQSNMMCSWQISAQPNERLIIQFTNMSLEFSPNCSADSVAVDLSKYRRMKIRYVS
jgi:CUB domain